MLVPFFGKTATVPNMATRAVSVSDQIDVSYCITFQADSVEITMPLCGAGCKVRHLNIFNCAVFFGKSLEVAKFFCKS
ncbi:MAG: hypothetical protein EBW37_00950 [Rhodobacteraceae bacterium]|nr:hypothetical protein [Paracoccaceae bacterium]